MEIFEKAGFSFTCRRTKTEPFQYDDVIHHVLLSCYRFSFVSAFSCGWPKTIRIPKCGWVFFFLENEEKDLRFQKNPDTCGRGLRFRYFSLSYYRNINVMTSPLFTKRHHYNLRNKSTIVFQKCNLNNRQSLIRC